MLVGYLRSVLYLRRKLIIAVAVQGMEVNFFVLTDVFSNLIVSYRKLLNVFLPPLCNATML